MGIGVKISKNRKEKVIEILNKYPKSKDNDNLLACYIWQEDLNKLGRDIAEIPTHQFFNLMSKGELTSYETIRRIRAKLQSEIPNLRGEKYFERANKENEVKTDLRLFHDL